MDVFDFGEWCIISKREYWEDASNTKETSNKLDPSIEDDDFVIVSEDLARGECGRTNSYDKCYDANLELQNTCKTPPNAFIAVAKESTTLLDSETENFAGECSDRSYLNFTNSLTYANTLTKERDVAQAANFDDEDEHIISISPLFDYYVPIKEMKNNLNINQTCFDYLQKDITRSCYERVSNIISSSCTDILFDQNITGYWDTMQDFDREVESCTIDDMCFEKEFHLPLMNQFCPLDLVNHES